MGLNYIKYSKVETWWIREVWNTRVHIWDLCTSLYIFTIYTNLHNVHRWISFLSAQSCYHKLPQAQWLRRTRLLSHSSGWQESIISFTVYVCVHARSCPTPWDPTGYSILCPWDSPGKNNGVHAIFSSRGSSGSRDRTLISFVSCTGRLVDSLPLVPFELKSNCGRVGSFWKLWRENLFPCVFQPSVAAHTPWCMAPSSSFNLICFHHYITFLSDSSCVPVITPNLPE